MSRRGRKSGYRNFSIAEQMPLCSVVGDILPLGRNMWDQVALWYNSRRPRGTSERDFEALRRKFRSLYGKPKPPGYNGEISESKKPIAFAHKSTESLNSAPDLHSTTMALMTVPMMQSCVAPSVDEVVAESEEDENEEIRQEDTQDEDSPPDTDLPDVPPARTYTQKSTQASVAASVEDSVDEWVSDREERADSTSTTENVQTLGTNLDFIGPETPIPSSASQGRAAPFTAGPRAPTSRANASSTRTSGRPRRPSREHIPSEATPDGPVLNRDPDNELADSNEMARYRLSAASNRLGGGDLRVLRDNFEKMGGGGRLTPAAEKRPPPDSTNAAAYTTNKRVNARKRIETLEMNVARVSATQEAAGSDLLQMLAFCFQKQVDRRAEQEDKLRRDERQERRDTEKEDRLERDPIRRDEVAAADSRTRRSWRHTD
ncbi:hypothetical protein F441_19415 [Phytophthora nicotianae CJ01A1]|uniref:DUF6818 domain-containing protein n=1 Tax=Phytophthora nicotianae CJ01A1 TaxID=1317063 RepID=W2W207_PHYNI|nr:hypothetical protein F441_19415 [Phytophthora nicotianae CJ01A1]